MQKHWLNVSHKQHLLEYSEIYVKSRTPPPPVSLIGNILGGQRLEGNLFMQMYS